MNSAKLSTVSKGLFLSAALAASTSAHANSVNVIYAAENALYGAGYNIGRADGWMDKALRQGIRDFQARKGTLTASGILDSETLSALGVSNSSARAISDNVVSSKSAAMAALGISDAKKKTTAKTKPQPQRRLQPKPAFTVKEIAPEPAVTPVATRTPVEPKKTQTLAVADQPKPPIQPQNQPQSSKSTDTVVAEAAPKAVPQNTVTPPAKVVKDSASVPAEPKAVPAPQAVDKPAPSTDVAKVKSPASETSEPTSAETVAWMKQLPNESTTAEKPVDTVVDEPVAQAPKAEAPETASAEAAQKEQPAKPENDRNIFGSLFHFLFGWMV